ACSESYVRVIVIGIPATGIVRSVTESVSRPSFKFPCTSTSTLATVVWAPLSVADTWIVYAPLARTVGSKTPSVPVIADVPLPIVCSTAPVSDNALAVQLVIPELSVMLAVTLVGDVMIAALLGAVMVTVGGCWSAGLKTVSVPVVLPLLPAASLAVAV